MFPSNQGIFYKTDLNDEKIVAGDAGRPTQNAENPGLFSNLMNKLTSDSSTNKDADTTNAFGTHTVFKDPDKLAREENTPYSADYKPGFFWKTMNAFTGKGSNNPDSSDRFDAGNLDQESVKTIPKVEIKLPYTKESVYKDVSWMTEYDDKNVFEKDINNATAGNQENTETIKTDMGREGTMPERMTKHEMGSGSSATSSS